MRCPEKIVKISEYLKKKNKKIYIYMYIYSIIFVILCLLKHVSITLFIISTDVSEVIVSFFFNFIFLLLTSIIATKLVTVSSALCHASCSLL